MWNHLCDTLLFADPRTAASGRIGDWLFDNGTVRFIVQDAGSATGWGVHGGSLVDLSIGPTRDDGPEDHLQEIFFHCDLRAFRPESAQLINDGSDGQPAVLRMVGKDGGFPLLDSLLRSRPIGVEATIEYRLEAGSDTLEIRQVVTDTLRCLFLRLLRLPMCCLSVYDSCSTMPSTTTPSK